MIGTLIGAGLGLASSIAGGIANRKARKKQEQMLAQQQRDNQAWYDRKYNEDPTKRADTVRLLTQMQEQIKSRNRAAKGRQAVMGGTEFYDCGKGGEQQDSCRYDLSDCSCKRSSQGFYRTTVSTE